MWTARAWLSLCIYGMFRCVSSLSLTESLGCVDYINRKQRPDETIIVQDNLHLRSSYITKTYLYNFDPLKPHFYIVKLGFTGVNIIFLISAQKHRLCEAVLTSTHNLCFEQKCENYQSFLSENFQFLEMKFSIYLNRHVFIMTCFNTILLTRLISSQKY